MNPRVASVRALPELTLQLEFQDGRRATFDLTPYVTLTAFQRLSDPAYFRQVKVDHGTVQWPGGIDFDPDTLYLQSRSI